MHRVEKQEHRLWNAKCIRTPCTRDSCVVDDVLARAFSREKSTFHITAMHLRTRLISLFRYPQTCRSSVFQACVFHSRVFSRPVEAQNQVVVASIPLRIVFLSLSLFSFPAISFRVLGHLGSVTPCVGVDLFLALVWSQRAQTIWLAARAKLSTTNRTKPIDARRKLSTATQLKCRTPDTARNRRRRRTVP